MENTDYVALYGLIPGTIVSLIFAFKKQIKSLLMYFIDSTLNKLGKRSIDKREIEHHPFFIFMNDCLRYRISSVRFESKAKTIIFQKFLKSKFQSFLDGYLVFADKEVLQMNPNELRNKIMDTFSMSIKNHKDSFRQILIEELKGDEELYDIVIHKFDEWHNDTIRDTKEEIEDAFLYRKQNIDIIWECLTALKFGFRRTMSDGVRSFKELNGELEAIEI